MTEELKDIIKYLRLNGLLEYWKDYIELAQKKNFSNTKFLTHVLKQEYQLKQENAYKLRLRKARIGEKYTIQKYPFKEQPKLRKKSIIELYDSYSYIEDKHNILFIGPTGVGKTGLATSFLMNALEQGCSGKFITFPELIEELYRSVADHSEKKILKKYSSIDCLLIDELGYIEIEPVQVGLFFTLMSQRHKTASTLITTNLGFQDWTSFLKNKQLTAALIDRLTENSNVVNMSKCKSLRAKLKPN